MFNKMKVISLFNHKGGVCKTTTTYHLGWMLTQKGRRVLLVDADSQCNLTLSVIGEDNYETFFEANPTNNIKNCLDSAFYSKPELIQPAECIQVKDNPNLFLLPGSFDITEFEVQLSVSFQLTGSFSTMMNLPGSFYYLLQKTAEKHNIDYIIVDLNPSLSAINQDLIISSDAFVLPASPDYFSEMAIKSISRILPNWEKWAEQARIMFANSTYPLPLTRPMFLGYTVNDYTIRNGVPAQAFREIISKIDSTVTSVLIPSLSAVNLLFDSTKYEGNYCLAQISNFQTLQAKYQKYGVPVYTLTDQQLESTGKVLEDQKQRRDNFNQVYSDFAEKVIRMLEN